jgi:hypothetical protein
LFDTSTWRCGSRFDHGSIGLAQQHGQGRNPGETIAMDEATRELVENCLTALKSDGFLTGPGWTRAHDICQAREGEPVFDRIHALIHRIEGDGANASYWYRRAGVAVFAGSFGEEAEAIRLE